jgi:predicted TIM-barrel fold metal-dependent hydrolase
MIIDCHTHIWASPDQLGPAAAKWLARRGGQESVFADPGDHAAAARDVTKTLVWGLRSRYLGADVPNAFLADYVAQHRDAVIGVAAVDPPEPDAMERLGNIARRAEFGGVAVSPAAQGFHPADTRAMAVYEFCARQGLPVFVEGGTDFAPQAALEFARPHLLDEVARAFPALTIVVSGLGSPWVQEAIALLAKQPRVYAEVADVLRRPWEAYQSLLLAHQRGVAGKLLFGSGFPFLTAAEAIQQLYRLNEITHGTGLPGVPRETLRGIVERDALAELGMA